MFDEHEARGDQDTDVPPWAGPGGVQAVRPPRPARRPAAAVAERAAEPSRADEPNRAAEPSRADRPEQDKPPRRGGRPGRTRAAATRRRRSKRRLTALAVVLVVAAAVVAAAYYLRQPAAAPSGPIDTLQKGEYSSVPDACRVVPAATLAQFVGAKPKLLRPQPGQCTFTVDAKPTFRQLNVQAQALQPNAGYGNGSATANASYNFTQQRTQLAKPPKHTPQPAAAITPVAGLADAAFVAVQVYHVGTGATTNKVTVLIRYKNVLVTASLQGGAGKGFGPAPVDQLRAGALAAARAVLAAVRAEQAVR